MARKGSAERRLKLAIVRSQILQNIILWLDMYKYEQLRYASAETILGTRHVSVTRNLKVVPQWLRIRGCWDDQVLPPVGSVVKLGGGMFFDDWWSISRFDGGTGNDRDDPWMVREIGGQGRCRVTNAWLDVLIGVPQHLLAEGWEKKMFLWAEKAMNERHNKRVDEFNTRYRGADLIDGKLYIHVGPHAWVSTKKVGDVDMCYRNRVFEIPVDKKTRLKDIIEALCDMNFDAEWSDDELVKMVTH